MAFEVGDLIELPKIGIGVLTRQGMFILWVCEKPKYPWKEPLAWLFDLKRGFLFLDGRADEELNAQFVPVVIP
jgi:hypothetical protein